MTATKNIRLQDVLKGFIVDFFSLSFFFSFFFLQSQGLLDGSLFISLSSYCAESPATQLLYMHTYPGTWFNCFFNIFFLQKRLKLCEQLLTSPLSALDFLVLMTKCLRFFSFSMVCLQLPYLPVSLKNRWKFLHTLMKEETLGRAGDKWSTQVPV